MAILKVAINILGNILTYNFILFLIYLSSYKLADLTRIPSVKKIFIIKKIKFEYHKKIYKFVLFNIHVCLVQF